MKRNIVHITTKNWDFSTPHWDSMWYVINLYENWGLINIKRVLNKMKQSILVFKEKNNFTHFVNYKSLMCYILKLNYDMNFTTIKRMHL